jgi:hypothetical protein
MRYESVEVTIGEFARRKTCRITFAGLFDQQNLERMRANDVGFDQLKLT